MPVSAQTPTPLQVILHKPILVRIYAEAQQQQEDLLRVRECLPPTWQAHCTAACVTGETLVLFVTQASWATRLRYQAVNLCLAVSTPSRVVHHLRVRIMAALDSPRPLPQHPVQPRLSAQQLAQWRALVGLPPKTTGSRPERS